MNVAPNHVYVGMRFENAEKERSQNAPVFWIVVGDFEQILSIQRLLRVCELNVVSPLVCRDTMCCMRNKWRNGVEEANNDVFDEELELMT